MHRSFFSFSGFRVYQNKSSCIWMVCIVHIVCPLSVILQNVIPFCTWADTVEIAVFGQSVWKLISRRLKQLKNSIRWSRQHFSVFMWHKIRIPTETLFYENQRFLLEILKTLKRCSSLIFHRREKLQTFLKSLWPPL